MGRIVNFRDLLGLIKDKASMSKAALLSKPNALSIRLAVLRATTHTPRTPPDDHHISALLLLGDSSRANASPIITALMDRLRRTGNCVVALKCLLIIHQIIKRGPFILQDQLSVFPATGGYNYLKLSEFRDGATANTWALSSWVRWYARYLETLLSISRVLGYFPCSSSCSVVKEKQEHRISSFLNLDLIKDVDSIVTLIEEICNVPDSLAREGDMLLQEIMGLLLNDYISSVNEILLRLGEINERTSCLSFGDSVELVCALKRLQDCQERLSVLYLVRKPSIEMMWGLVQELKDKVGILKVCKEGGNLLSLKASESARFDQRVLGAVDSVGFRSGRFDLIRNVL
ncbi:putative clathrin assembly protein [Sesamum alatum]|uniref:Clathrin assembly protein n=1 Tax=Sesamum alatum TaxID=300844 RepID=A0AAE1XT87_9LAMI|nr:putative clathrin assembly protein [Sesamum alatum]